MELTIYNERENSTTTIAFSGKTVQDLLRHQNINPETVLVVRNNEVLLETEEVWNKDQITFLSVISGG